MARVSKKLEKNKEIVRKWANEVFNKHNLDYMDQGYVRDYVNFDPYPGQDDTLPPFKELMAAFLAAYPDMRIKIEELIAEGNAVVSIGIWSGTNKGAFLGIPPTGRKVVSRRIDVFRFSGTKIIERWGTGNDIPKLEVVRAIPAMPPVKGAADARDVARHFADQVFKRRNLSAVDHLVDDNATQNARETVEMFLSSAAFPESSVSVSRLTAEGDRVKIPMTITGPQRAAFAGAAASDEPVTAENVLSVRVEGGRIVESSFQFNPGGADSSGG